MFLSRALFRSLSSTPFRSCARHSYPFNDMVTCAILNGRARWKNVKPHKTACLEKHTYRLFALLHTDKSRIKNWQMFHPQLARCFLLASFYPSSTACTHVSRCTHGSEVSSTYGKGWIEAYIDKRPLYSDRFLDSNLKHIKASGWRRKVSRDLEKSIS